MCLRSQWCKPNIVAVEGQLKRTSSWWQMLLPVRILWGAFFDPIDNILATMRPKGTHAYDEESLVNSELATHRTTLHSGARKNKILTWCRRSNFHQFSFICVLGDHCLFLNGNTGTVDRHTNHLLSYLYCTSRLHYLCNFKLTIHAVWSKYTITRVRGFQNHGCSFCTALRDRSSPTGRESTRSLARFIFHNLLKSSPSPRPTGTGRSHKRLSLGACSWSSQVVEYRYAARRLL